MPYKRFRLPPRLDSQHKADPDMPAVLDAARAYDIVMVVDGGMLNMTAPREPPAHVIDMIRQHKPAILAMLTAMGHVA